MDQENTTFENSVAPTPEPSLKEKLLQLVKKRWYAFAVALVAVIAIFVMLSGDPVQDDLIDYINNDIPTISALDEEVHDLYDASRNGNDYTMYLMLKEQIIPKSQELIDAAEAISTETNEVREVHEIYLNVINTQNQAFTLMLSALEAQDFALVTQANEKLDTARKEMRDYTAAVKTLAKDHDVEFTSDAE